MFCPVPETDCDIGQTPRMTYPMDAKPPMTINDDKMKSVKDVRNKSPAGAKKNAAVQHCQAAEKAHAAKNDAETNLHLDAANHAVA